MLFSIVYIVCRSGAPPLYWTPRPLRGRGREARARRCSTGATTSTATSSGAGVLATAAATATATTAATAAATAAPPPPSQSPVPRARAPPWRCRPPSTGREGVWLPGASRDQVRCCSYFVHTQVSNKSKIYDFRS